MKRIDMNLESGLQRDSKSLLPREKDRRKNVREGAHHGSDRESVVETARLVLRGRAP